MNMIRLYICLIVSVFCLYLPTSAYALSCEPPVLNQDAIDQAELIFLGQTKGVLKDNPAKQHNGTMEYYEIYEFNVDRLWKGPSDQNKFTIVKNSYWGGRFIPEYQYFIVAGKNEFGAYEAFLCGNTTSIHGAGDKIEILRLREELLKKEQD